jgi:hypothetical protein
MDEAQIRHLVQSQVQESCSQMSVVLTQQLEQFFAAEKEKSQVDTSPAENDNRDHMLQDPSEQDSELEEDSWSDVLVQNRRFPSGSGKALVSRMQSPPPLDAIRETLSQVVPVVGVPQTAPPRRQNRVDRLCWTTQVKIEATMNLLVDIAESTNTATGPLIQCAAFLRSSFEDLTDYRRRSLAGVHAGKLDKRSDLSGPRLLSPSEEKMLSSMPRSEKGKGKGKGFPQPAFRPLPRWQSRPRSLSRGRKGGKSRNGGQSSNQE